MKKNTFTFDLMQKDDDGTDHWTLKDTKSTTAESADFTFDALEYSQADIGRTYYYKVEEQQPSNTSYSKAEAKEFSVTVKDGGNGQLKLVTNPENLAEVGLTFDNGYQASGSITLKGHKTINGQKPTEVQLKKNTFTFDLMQKDDDGTDHWTLKDTKSTTAESADFTFDTLNYTQADIGKTYEYKVEEEEPANKKYSQAKAQTFKVTVEDGGNGQLKLVTNPENLAEVGLTFDNGYQASGSITLKGHKTINGQTPSEVQLKKNTFTFDLMQKKDDGTDGWEVKDTKSTTAESADFTFDTLSYSQADIGKTYEYKVVEQVPTNNKSYSKAADQEFSVTVEDGGNGQLKLTTDPKNLASEGLTFDNGYQASGELTLKGTKTLFGRKLKAGEFSFTIQEKDHPENQWKGTLEEGTEAGKAAQITFAPITYELKDVGTHTYTVTEDPTSLPGIATNNQKFTVIVEVKDKGDGTLSTSQEIYDADGKKLDADQPMAFVNHYKANSVALRLSGNKQLSGADLSQYAGLFRFELKYVKHASKRTIDTAKNDTTGRFTFAPLVFDQIGDYTYTISEINGGKTIDGIAYDSSVYTVKVTVTDNNEGQLLASASIEDENGKVVATAETDANGDFTFKTSEGKDLEYKDGKQVADENQAISFTNKKLTEVTVNKNWNDNRNQEGLRPDSITLELLKNGTVVRTTQLSGAGDTWSYTFRDLEPANYTVHESSDSPYYEVDHNDLTADTSKGDQTVTLTNTYGRKVDVTAYKDLTGTKLLEGEFHFKLHRNSDADSSKDIEAVNNADGTINFSDVDYDAKGYTVYELRDSSLTDITFDEKNSYDPADPNPIDYTKTGIHFNADGEPTDAKNYTIQNQYRPIVLRVQKRSKSAPYDPLVNAVYGLYQVNENGNDILVESERSDENGYMYYGRIEPGTVYYFKEISAPAGHEVDPYPGQHFMVKYIGNGKIAVYDETGTTKLDYGDITESPEEQAKPYRTIQVNTEKTDLDSITASENEEKYSYSGNGVKAVATAAKGVLPEGTRLLVKKVDPKTEVASYQSPTGVKTQSLETMLENNVGEFTGLAYYDICFMNGDKEIEPTGDVHVTLEPDQALDLQGADPSDLKIIHIVESGEPEDLTRTVSLVNGAVASDGKSILQTSLTSDSFSVYALVDPKDSTTLNGNYMLTAAGVGDFTAKLRVAKVDSSGNFIPNATLCVYKFDATKKDGLGKKVLEWTSAEGVKDWQRAVDVNTPYVLVETNAPKGYKIADNIYFSIGKYHSELTCYAYDAKTGKLTESQELTQKNTNGSELVMVDDPIMVTTNYKTKVIPNHKSRTEDKVLYVPGSPKTGEFTASMPWALPLASAAMVILILTGYLLGKKKRSRK